jgi:CheY-like chemotaxis protein
VATILIVDDEGPIRDFLAELLSDAGHRTLQAIHGAQALEMVDSEQPDLVISDIMMPFRMGRSSVDGSRLGPVCRRLP